MACWIANATFGVHSGTAGSGPFDFLAPLWSDFLDVHKRSAEGYAEDTMPGDASVISLAWRDRQETFGRAGPFAVQPPTSMRAKQGAS